MNKEPDAKAGEGEAGVLDDDVGNDSFPFCFMAFSCSSCVCRSLSNSASSTEEIGLIVDGGIRSMVVCGCMVLVDSYMGTYVMIIRRYLMVLDGVS